MLLKTLAWGKASALTAKLSRPRKRQRDRDQKLTEKTVQLILNHQQVGLSEVLIPIIFILPGDKPKMGLKTPSCLAWLSFLSLAMTMVASPAAADDNPGTTEHIQDIFMGRCYDYKQIKYKSVLPQVREDCAVLYKEFFKAFSMMPPCAVDASNYQPFMQAAMQVIPQDKAMFWSGVKALAHEYALEGERYVTLEDTLIGYVVDGMVWCGQSNPPGMNYTRCPSWNDCPSEASEAFWALASETFAQTARGNVTVMMDVSRAGRPAYRRNSFFGTHELPNLHRDLVTEILVILTHPPNTPGYENCGNGSVVLMEQDVTSRGFVFKCMDDPEAIIHLLCVDNPLDRACHLAHKSMFGGPNAQEHTNNVGHSLVINSKPNRFDTTSQLIGRRNVMATRRNRT